MKKLIIIISILSSSVVFAETKNVSINDVADYVKKQNFEILTSAQRVYQAKETINFNKKNLLPRLNLWTIISTPFDWRSAVGIVGDIAPFLVPNNWLRVKQSEVLYFAKKEQYRALWANEVMSAKLLYLNVLRDMDFYKIYEEQYFELRNLVEIVKALQMAGEVPVQVLNFLKIRELQFTEDLRILSNMIFEEQKALNYLMGFPQEDSVELESVTLPVITDLEPIHFETFIFRALNSSPEINQYVYMKNALKYVKKEVWFSFLGASSASRGINGGIFDNIPIQDGLGFGVGPSIRIAKSEGKVLDIRKEATSEVIKKSLFNLVKNYNSYIENIDNQNNRLILAETNHELIKAQLLMGERVDPLEVLESITNLLDVKLSLFNYKYDALASTEKLKRMIFNGDYNKLESSLEEVLK